MSARVLTDADMVVASQETVLGTCRSCGDETYVIKTVSVTGWVRYSKCGPCYL